MKSIEVVAAVIRDGDRVLATQRGYGEFKDWWEFPGGKIEAGESACEALIREIREELDAQIELEGLIDTVEWDYPTFHLTLHCYWARVLSEIRLNEHEAMRWLSAEELYCVKWLPADDSIIKKIAEAIS